jgi:cardiolipin synthase
MLWNLPNILTLSRIAAIPVIVALMFMAEAWAAWTALGLYSLACFTDWLDGHLARLQNLESPIGKFLDPIADKLLIGALLLTMAGTDRLSFWGLPAAIIILMREILVSGLREYLAGLKQISIPVSRLAKWKTALQMIALGLLIVWPWGPLNWPWQSIAELGLWLAAVITVITGWDYLLTGLRHMSK